jgi:tetratricopeptide (TPR) repeat protein
MAGKPAIINMQDASEESRHTVLVLTPKWVESEWTLYESILSRTDDPSGLQRRTIPLLLEKCDVPKFISMLSWVDFTNKKREDEAWQNLFKSLDKEVEKIEVAKAEPDSWHLAHPYPMPPNFTGRVAERTLLTNWLNEDTENRLFVLRALGGFGKSALTWHWLTHDFDSKEWNKVVFWSFYEGDASFEHFIEETLKYLNIAVPQGQRPQVDALLKAMQAQKILLIMDGFERALRAYSSMNAAYQGDSELPSPLGEGLGGGVESSLDCVNLNAEIFLKHLCSLPNIKSKVLMTTRLTPRAVKPRGEFMLGCREVELTSMQPADAVEFFHKQKIKGTHTEVEAACAPYGYHPLSLRLLAGRILKDFENPADILVAQKLKIDGDLKQHQHHVLEFSYNSLPEHEQNLLSTIACFRSPVELNTLEAIEENNKSLHDDLHDLVERGLLHFDEKNKKFDLHPIVRCYAYEELPNKKQTHEKLVQYFQKTTKAPPKPYPSIKAHWVSADPSSWYPKDILNFDDLSQFTELYYHIVQIGNLDDAYNLFRHPLITLINQIGANLTAIELLNVFFSDGENKPPQLESEISQADVLSQLAQVYIQVGQPRRALSLYDTREKLTSKYDEITTHISIVSGILIPLGKLSLAQTILQSEINTVKDSTMDIHKFEIYNEIFLRQVLRILLSYCGAWKAVEQEFDTIQTIGENIIGSNIRFLSLVFHAQYLLLLRRDKSKLSTKIHESAIIYAHHALELAEKQEGNFPQTPYLVRAHWLLGAAYRIENQPSLAENHLTTALMHDRAINLVEMEANILLDLARLRYDQKKTEEAKSLADEALLITERSGYVLQGADVNLFLAQYALEQEKDKVKAKEYAEEALKLATCDGPPYYYKVAYEEAERFLEKLNNT